MFLNLRKSFEREIDWDYSGYGKLWTYNLNYFDYLLQEEIEQQTALDLIGSFCAQPDGRITGIEPYPTSLRGINWIKFFCYQEVQNPKFNAILFEHYRFLASNVEYHLMGNHLLENGFSLLFGAYYFRDEKFHKKASDILQAELNEQILSDGAHFELSPMYHQILLFRLLDCINLIKNNDWKNHDLLDIITKKAILMIGWLKAITFRNGEVPMVNDAAYGIAPTTDSIIQYANRLGLACEPAVLSGSGYRMIRLNSFEIFADVGNIGPDYIPGHAHSDSLSFVLYSDDHPVIVDVGTSTYEKGSLRLFERSTEAHNTVMVDDLQQSEVWASFRVGRRAKIIQLDEGDHSIVACHDGYKSVGVTHKRSWIWGGDEIRIMDEILARKQNRKSVAFIHFHPDVEVRIEEDVILADVVKIKCTGHKYFEIGEYEFAAGYNKTRTGKVLKIYFDSHLQTILSKRQNVQA